MRPLSNGQRGRCKSDVPRFSAGVPGARSSPACLCVGGGHVAGLNFSGSVDSQSAWSWVAWISAGGISAAVAILAYDLNREVAIRTATIEAQKMLLELNKQYVAKPELLYIEGEYIGSVDLKNVAFLAQLKAMVYLKLNVFEVIFATLPRGSEREAWIRYFSPR